MRPTIIIFSSKLRLALAMHLALSIMHLTLLSANMIALLEAISVISFSPILATSLGSNPAKASLWIYRH